MEVSAREATALDAGDVQRLAALALEELTGERGADLWFRVDARPQLSELVDLASAPSRSSAVLFVGTVDDAVVGFAAGHLAATHDGAALGVVTELYVEGDGRQVGVGDVLLCALMDRFRSLGAIGVDSWALPGARLTKNFYEAHGFTARALIVHHRFDVAQKDDQRADVAADVAADDQETAR